MILTQNDHQKIRDLLLFRSVEKVADDKLVLDNGTVLTIEANEGCWGCASGWYGISELNGCENAITHVSVDESYQGDTTVYQIFVLAENKTINLLTVDGTDGNGYYGTGYQIRVSLP